MERAPGTYGIFKHRAFSAYLAARTFSVLGAQMTAVTVGWQVYVRTGSALALGVVGLLQVVPVLLLAPWAGRYADRANRRAILVVTHGVRAACALGLFLTDRCPDWPLAVLYAILVVDGVALSFQSPATQALMPSLVPVDLLSHAVAWRVVSFEISSIAGPALAGFLIGWSGLSSAYAAAAALGAVSVVSLLALKRHRPAALSSGSLFGASPGESLWTGFRYVWERPVLRGALALDLFAVLFGGATALLPVFARDILEVGPEGLGILRAAPSAGALVMSLGLLHRRPMTRAGRSLLFCVAGYGVCMTAFGLSTSFPLSATLLFASGLFDAVSVVIRHTILQAMTPDVMRGRVSAVNGVFIQTSNQLGEFESGVAAALLGAARSVVFGGLATLAVVCLFAWRAPKLRRLGRLDGMELEAPVT